MAFTMNNMGVNKRFKRWPQPEITRGNCSKSSTTLKMMMSKERAHYPEIRGLARMKWNLLWLYLLALKHGGKMLFLTRKIHTRWWSSLSLSICIKTVSMFSLGHSVISRIVIRKPSLCKTLGYLYFAFWLITDMGPYPLSIIARKNDIQFPFHESQKFLIEHYTH